MTQQSILHRPSSTQAFSLIEVVLALAIVGIGLVTILGLFPQVLSSAKGAADDSLAAIIAQDTIAGRRIDIQNGALALGATDIRWFAVNGREILITNPVDAATAMFKCRVTGAVGAIPNLEATRIVVVWPWFAPSATSKFPPNTNIFVTHITKY